MPAVSHLDPESFLFWLMLSRDLARAASDEALQRKQGLRKHGELQPVQAGEGRGAWEEPGTAPEVSPHLR